MTNEVFIDIGNSNTKWQYQGSFFEVATKEFNVKKLPQVSKIWASNVCNHYDIDCGLHFITLKSEKLYKGLINSYKDPTLLGSDWWFAMIASYEMSINNSFMVIDIGSAVTIDLVDNKGLHHGGIIFPGLENIRQIFGYFPTSINANISGIGQTTEDAWTIGTLSLIVNNINCKYNELRKLSPGIKVFVTGGGYFQVQQYLNFIHEYHKNLVLDGLELYVNNMG